MNYRYLSSLAALLAVFSFELQAKKPHLFITSWVPGSYGTYPGIGHQKKPLRIYIKATFDQPVSEDLANNYLKYLHSQVKQLCRTVNPGELAFTVLGTSNRSDVELLLEKANRHFDPDFKTPQELAQIEVQERFTRETIEKATIEEAPKREQEEKVRKERECRREKTSEPKQTNSIDILRAVLLGDRNGVKSSLDRGCDPNCLYLDKPIVHYAIKQGYVEIAKLLVAAGADFWDFFEEGQDAFTYVASRYDMPAAGQSEQPDLDLLQTMVKCGYDIKSNFANPDLKNNAWYLSIANNKSNHVGCFLGWGGKFANNSYSLLMAADPNKVFVCADNSIMSPLLKAVMCYDAKKSIPGGSISIIKKLIDSGADLNGATKTNGIVCSPLSSALARNDRYLIDFLIRSGANIAESIELFVQSGGDKNSILQSDCSGYWSLLGMVVRYQDIEAIRLLLKMGANVNQYIDPYPPITDVGRIQHYKRYGDPHAILRGPHRILFYALHESNDEIIKLLLEHGAQV